jgi:hypothetical protein
MYGTHTLTRTVETRPLGTRFIEDVYVYVQVGLGTDEAAVRLLLSGECFGTTRVAVVRDIFDRNVARKHLV